MTSGVGEPSNPEPRSLLHIIRTRDGDVGARYTIPGLDHPIYYFPVTKNRSLRSWFYADPSVDQFPIDVELVTSPPARFQLQKKPSVFQVEQILARLVEWRLGGDPVDADLTMIALDDFGVIDNEFPGNKTSDWAYHVRERVHFALHPNATPRQMPYVHLPVENDEIRKLPEYELLGVRLELPVMESLGHDVTRRAHAFVSKGQLDALSRVRDAMKDALLQLGMDTSLLEYTVVSALYQRTLSPATLGILSMDANITRSNLAYLAGRATGDESARTQAHRHLSALWGQHLDTISGPPIKLLETSASSPFIQSVRSADSKTKTILRMLLAMRSVSETPPDLYYGDTAWKTLSAPASSTTSNEMVQFRGGDPPTNPIATLEHNMKKLVAILRHFDNQLGKKMHPSSAAVIAKGRTSTTNWQKIVAGLALSVLVGFAGNQLTKVWLGDGVDGEANDQSLVGARLDDVVDGEANDYELEVVDNYDNDDDYNYDVGRQLSLEPPKSTYDSYYDYDYTYPLLSHGFDSEWDVIDPDTVVESVLEGVPANTTFVEVLEAPEIPRPSLLDVWGMTSASDPTLVSLVVARIMVPEKIHQYNADVSSILDDISNTNRVVADQIRDYFKNDGAADNDELVTKAMDIVQTILTKFDLSVESDQHTIVLEPHMMSLRPIINPSIFAGRKLIQLAQHEHKNESSLLEIGTRLIENAVCFDLFKEFRADQQFDELFTNPDTVAALAMESMSEDSTMINFYKIKGLIQPFYSAATLENIPTIASSLNTALTKLEFTISGGGFGRIFTLFNAATAMLLSTLHADAQLHSMIGLNNEPLVGSRIEQNVEVGEEIPTDDNPELEIVPIHATTHNMLTLALAPGILAASASVWAVRKYKQHKRRQSIYQSFQDDLAAYTEAQKTDEAPLPIMWIKQMTSGWTEDTDRPRQFLLNVDEFENDLKSGDSIPAWVYSKSGEIPAHIYAYRSITHERDNAVLPVVIRIPMASIDTSGAMKILPNYKVLVYQRDPMQGELTYAHSDGTKGFAYVALYQYVEDSSAFEQSIYHPKRVEGTKWFESLNKAVPELERVHKS